MSDVALTTKRLTLRPFEPTDAANIERFIGAWDVARMLTRVPYPYPAGGAAEWMSTHPQQRADKHGYYFAIVVNGECAGCIGIHNELDDPTGSVDGSFVLGYWLGIPYWGRGLMSEAVSAVIEFALRRLEKQRLDATFLLDNRASGRVLQKAGFSSAGTRRVHSLSRNAEVEMAAVALTRDAWLAQQV